MTKKQMIAQIPELNRRAAQLKINAYKLSIKVKELVKKALSNGISKKNQATQNHQ